MLFVSSMKKIFDLALIKLEEAERKVTRLYSVIDQVPASSVPPGAPRLPPGCGAFVSRTEFKK